MTLPHIQRTLLTVVRLIGKLPEPQNLNYKQIQGLYDKHLPCSVQNETKSAGRFESSFLEFFPVVSYSSHKFFHHVMLLSLPPPCKIEVWLQGTNSHAENPHAAHQAIGISGMLTPRERTSSLEKLLSRGAKAELSR